MTLNYYYKLKHQSFLTLNFAADEVSFVEHRSPGRIVKATIEDFVALAGSSNLTVIVQNLGTITADYTVRGYYCYKSVIQVI